MKASIHASGKLCTRSANITVVIGGAGNRRTVFEEQAGKREHSVAKSRDPMAILRVSTILALLREPLTVSGSIATSSRSVAI